jgi:hypothetical protein
MLALAGCGGGAGSSGGSPSEGDPVTTGTAPGSSAISSQSEAGSQGKARSSITIGDQTHEFTGGKCVDNRPTAATSDFLAMFYPSSGDYMSIAMKDGSVVMVAGRISGVTLAVSHVQGTMKADETGAFSGVDAITGAEIRGSFSCR